jgi:hypothetical protein
MHNTLAPISPYKVNGVIMKFITTKVPLIGMTRIL